MAAEQEAFTDTGAAIRPAMSAFGAWSARRLLIFGGLALIVVGMIFGDIFAVFVLHQNAARISETLLAATKAAADQDAAAVLKLFTAIGGFLENHGTKVDAHVHIIKFGYIALLLAFVQPYVALSEQRKRRLAELFLVGSVLLPVGVFLIHYVGLAFSPLEMIGWASIAADVGGLLVIVACVGELVGLWRYLRGARQPMADEAWLTDRSWSSRTLLVGGTLLVLAGFLHGAYYAAFDLYEHEAKDVATLRAMMEQAAMKNLTAAAEAVNDYGALQAEKAVKIAAHAHIIEFGFLAMMLALIQPYVYLSERWKRRWVIVMLLGSVILPVFVLLEIEWGLVAGGIADVGGLLVVIALIGMLVGVLRYTGKLDAEKGAAG